MFVALSKYVSFALVLLSSTVAAHHSRIGIFDSDRTIELAGTVLAFSNRNPHGNLELEVIDERGQRVVWDVETAALSMLRNVGLDRDFVAPGDHIRVAGYPSSRGRMEMLGRNILRSDSIEIPLGIGIEPRWPEGLSGNLLAPEYNEAATAAAIESADGLFRVWSTVFGDRNAFPMYKGNYPLNEQAQTTRQQWDPVNNDLLYCAKKPMPYIMISPYPIEFVRDGDDIVIRFEEDDAVRRIHMNPTAQPPDEHSLYGFSIGRWVNDTTLLVNTSRIVDGHFDGNGVLQSSQIVTTERFTLDPDINRLDYTIEISDPETFTETFELSRYFIWRPEITVRPYECVTPD